MAEIIIEGLNRTLRVADGTTLFLGLIQSGIPIPSSCGGRGLCGLCKIKVIAGAPPLTQAETARLTPGELAQGFRLSCQIPVGGPLRIEIAQSVLAAKQFRGQVVRKRSLTPDIVELRIRLIEPARIGFVAGQYVRLRSETYDGRPSVERPYSISSPPSDSGAIELIIRRVPGGICTTWVFDVLKEGQQVEFLGPYGDFHFSGSGRPALFIAGGSGLAPFWSILRDLKHKRIRREIILLFGALTGNELLLVSDLDRLQSELPGFVFVPALSREPEESDWRGERGLITEVLCRKCPEQAQHDAYLCGSPGMIEACLKVLRAKGITEDRIFYDKFA